MQVRDKIQGQSWWLTPAILAALEVEIRRIADQDKLRQKVIKNTFQPISWAWWLCGRHM
jgi:hypothetical protein